jgi:hypothetical protein
MALAHFKKLCIDANDPSRLGAFWAAVLGVTWTPDDNGDGLVSGPEPHPRIWVNRVPEPKSAKHRVHLDVYTTDLARLETLGSRILLPEGDGRRWTVMADPEDGEYCAFLRADLPERRLHGLVVDSADPPAQARWVGRGLRRSGRARRQRLLHGHGRTRHGDRDHGFQPRAITQDGQEPHPLGREHGRRRPARRRRSDRAETARRRHRLVLDRRP